MIEKRRNFVFRFLPGLFLSGLLLLSGCSQDDVSDVSAGSRAIDFRAQGGMSALKATTTGSEYIRSFAVNAHYGAYNAAGKFLMEGVTVYRGEGGGSSWTYSPQAYFPTTDEGDVDFFAYSPSGSKYVERSLKDAAVANDADQKITYVVPAPNGSATSQEDLLVARQTVAYNSGNSAYPGTAVGLQFHHALSRILVAASSSLGKEVPVAITKLELKNLYSKGDLSLSSLEIPVAEGWGYTNGVAGDKVLWTNYTGSTLASYAYSLPKSGVYVGETSATVTGDDQGIFVLPQTTKGNPGDGSPEAGVTDDGEFGLKVSYSINGSPDRDAYIQFCDITEPVDAAEGVTFEIGRQYVLNLTFGAGSDPDDPDPDINIGAKISFSELGVDGYDRDVNVPKMESDSWPEFSQSNIYYNNSLGVETLTFSEKEDGKNLYQGLFFKYGSLIGISAGASSTFFNASTYLFIPNLSTGKYSKVQVSELDNYNGSDPAVEEFIEVLEDNSFTDWGGTDDGYGGTTYSGLYAALPFVADGDVPANGSGRNENGLTVHSDASLYAQYKGDICKFMSYNSSASGLSGKWRLPVSSEFGPNRSDYTESANWSGSFTGGVSVDGTDKLAADYSFYTFSRVLTGTGKPSFPASGSTLYGTLTQVGFFGLYWSSSARNETDAYRLSIASGGSVNLNNGSGRSYGGSVRCVRE